MKVPYHKLRIIFETHSYAKGGKTDEAQIEKKRQRQHSKSRFEQEEEETIKTEKLNLEHGFFSDHIQIMTKMLNPIRNLEHPPKP